MNEVEPVDLEVGRKLTPGEHDYRLKLFEQCRNGEPEAVAELAKKYQGARIWTHEEVANYASLEATE